MTNEEIEKLRQCFQSPNATHLRLQPHPPRYLTAEQYAALKFECAVK